ncbi:MAG: PD-(D/E)XK nuclease family protein [Erythrobacter sp.]|jgi:ATP-dependent helicase/nuclease subunit B|nr:PD-(D/E)XK nuclease family protein [Erythrobacter sp.]
MAERRGPAVYSIAAHRGFADALVAGITARHASGDEGLARTTLLVPSSRAARTITEAFVRHLGTTGRAGMLMPRMATVGDLDLDEALGSLLDPLGAPDIPPAVEPTRRWLELAALIADEHAKHGEPPLPDAARLRLARELARTMDRLLVEDIAPSELVSDRVLDMLGDLSAHWIRSLHLFVGVQDRWLARLEALGQVDTATRRNLLFEHAAKRWRDDPPDAPIIAAGVTSAAPALARMLRVVAGLPNGAVILPDLDLTLSDDAWEELGRAGAALEPGGEVFGSRDALSHPQYHLKLLLHRMGVSREEVRPWHRKGIAAAPPARSHAISSLFLPPEASRSWIDLDPDKRRLAGVRLIAAASIEEEAQAIALLVREALETPEKRIAVITADRALARRIAQHLARWRIEADDSAGRDLALTPAGRLFGLLAQLVSEGPTPVTLLAALAHPLVRAQDGEERASWLDAVRSMERALRGALPSPGLAPLGRIAAAARLDEWWAEASALVAPLFEMGEHVALAEALDQLAGVAEALCDEGVWAREDGRALSAMIEDVRSHARDLGTAIARSDLASALRDLLDEVAVRPPYGGHPRVAILGLLEARMARADLVICAGLNEGSWPQRPAADPLLAPGVLRTLGVPGVEFRIGLSAHDLAGAMGAPEVVLSRARRDADGPTLPSRFLLRVEALLGELAQRHRDEQAPALAALLDRVRTPAPAYPRPMPDPTAEQRRVDISATALDRLLGDPYQFYAREILRLSPLDPLAADPFSDPALRGTLVHDILDAWHKRRVGEPDLALVPFAEAELARREVHPMFRGLWQPRILAALEAFERLIGEDAKAGRTILASEIGGAMMVDGVRVHGRADRIDRLADGTLAIVDYKTGKPPSASRVEAGFALQMGVLGLIARDGSFEAEGTAINGEATCFEYWSLAKKDANLGYRDKPLKVDGKKSGLAPEEFLLRHEDHLQTAISKYITGREPFTAKEKPDYPGFTDYDQLMRLEEWRIALSESGPGPERPA